MKVNIVKESLLKPNKKFTLLSAFITLLNDRLSESILLPILPSFVLLFDSKASTYGLLSCTYQLAQFTASPFIGLMSDRYGRRPVTLFCITGSVLGISILSFTTIFTELGLELYGYLCISELLGSISSEIANIHVIRLNDTMLFLNIILIIEWYSRAFGKIKFKIPA